MPMHAQRRRARGLIASLMRPPAFRLAVSFLAGVLATNGALGSETRQSCALTPPILATPADPPAEMRLGGWWYASADRSLWASAAPMSAGPRGNKVPWFRPQGTQLVVTGRRLDGESERPRFSVPCCYGGRFQASGMTFPSEGCWEVTAKAGESELVFVLIVQPATP